jgi:signal transduction histidine kinase
VLGNDECCIDHTESQRLAAGIAHEIRNPLAALRGFVQLMMTQGAKPHYLEIMAGELSRIERITEELMMLNKPRAVSLRRCELMKLVEEVTTLLEVQAQLHGIDMCILKPTGSVWLECEEAQIKQVLINVLKNGIEAMPDGGRLEVSASLQGEEIIIQIRDEGVGLTREQLRQAGEPFFTTKAQGTGLGLMMCRRIMEQHHGRLQLESEPGAGTRVSLTLPVAASNTRES